MTLPASSLRPYPPSDIMYFLYGGCHSHPPALLCSRCRRQYCSPANAWGIARPPVRRTKKTQRPTSATSTKSTTMVKNNSNHYNHNNNNVTKSSSGTLQRNAKVAGGDSTSSRSTSRSSSSNTLVVNPKVTTLSKKEPVKCGKSFAEKLRSLLSCIA